MRHWNYILGLLFLSASVVWLAYYFFPDDNLYVIACDVGQGDATLIKKGSVQILVDGGGNNKVLDCLGKHMPFWDRRIELVILTHPHADHYIGLIEVLRRFRVDSFMASGQDSGSHEFRVLSEQVRGSGVEVLQGRTGQRVVFGLIYLDIVHPPGEFVIANSEDFTNIASSRTDSTFGHPVSLKSASGGESQQGNILGAFTSNRNPNDFSVVVEVAYRDFSALLTGDVGPAVMDVVLGTGKVNEVNYLKVPHHGSKNGLTPELLQVTNPKAALISSGKNNRHGHPHPEVLKMLTTYSRRPEGDEIIILRTDEMGDVVVATDGESWWVVK